jgi:hypothetical protein
LDDCQHFHLTSQLDWDPDNMVVPQFDVRALEKEEVLSDTYDEDAEDEICNPVSFTHRIIASCRVQSIPPRREVQTVLTDVTAPPTFSTENRRADISPQSLADRWCIGLEQATLTVH